MDFKLPHSKKLWLAVEIFQLLYRYNCTYNEADEILKLITAEIKQQREDFEYDTIDEYFANTKSRRADHQIIQPLNHVDHYC